MAQQPTLPPDLDERTEEIDLLFLDEGIFWSQPKRFSKFKVIVFYKRNVNGPLYTRTVEEGAKACLSKSWPGDRLSGEIDRVRRNVGLVTTPVRVLVVEDTQAVREALVDGLEPQGYTIDTASFDEANAKINEYEPHVVITDRKIDKEDPDDDFGLVWANQLLERHEGTIQVVVLVPEEQKVTQQIEHLKVVKKDENKFLNLGRKINDSIKQLKLDFALNIRNEVDWDDIASLVRLEDSLPSRSIEVSLTDLIRKLFYKLSRVTLTGILDSEGETSGIFIRHDRADGTNETFLVRFGSWEYIWDEKTRFLTLGIKLKPRLDLFGTMEKTMRLGGFTLSFSGRFNDLPRNFAAFYRAEKNTEQVCTAVERFIQKTCINWYNNTTQPYDLPETIECYLTAVKDELLSMNTLTQEIDSLVDDREAYGIKFKKMGDQIEIIIAERFRFVVPNPLSYVKDLNAGNMFTEWATTNSCLNSRNIFVDPDSNLMPTEFHKTEDSPLLHDFSCLEAMVKFDLLPRSKFVALFEFEKMLLKPETLTEMDEDFEPPGEFGKAWCVIKRVRQLASNNSLPDEMREFFCCLLMRTLRILGKGLVIGEQRNSKTYQFRKRYALLSAAMIAGRLQTGSSNFDEVMLINSP